MKASETGSGLLPKAPLCEERSSLWLQLSPEWPTLVFSKQSPPFSEFSVNLLAGLKMWVVQHCFPVCQKSTSLGIPGGPGVKTLCYQSKRCRFDPWPGNWGPHTVWCGWKKKRWPFRGHRIKHSSLGLMLPVAAQPGAAWWSEEVAAASQAQPLGPRWAVL